MGEIGKDTKQGKITRFVIRGDKIIEENEIIKDLDNGVHEITSTGKDIIIFEVVIQNTTNQTQQVPTVISSLTDAEGNQVQEISTDPSKPMLEAGKILRFQAKFPDAPAAAKQSVAKWGAYPSSSGKNQDK